MKSRLRRIFWHEQGKLKLFSGGLLFWVAILVAACAASVGAQTASGQTPQSALAKRLAASLRLAGGAAGAWVEEVETGSSLFKSGADQRRVPASVQKLLTASTAFARLGEGTRFTTEALTDGDMAENGTLAGNLYIKGFGDPSFSATGVAGLVTRLSQAGVASVTGTVYGDDGYFDRRRGVPASGFSVSRYVGPLSALSFNGGAASGSALFQNDPPKFVAARLRAALLARGIEVTGTVRAGRSPQTAHELASVDSPELARLVRHMNHVSDNYFAETLLKGLGARFGGGGSTAAGAAVVNRYQRSIGMHARVVDGSGLSQANSVSPHDVGRLLLSVAREPWFDSFYRSLPLAGHDGTLRERMRGTPADGRCRAKTGTLLGVSALAGYCRSAQEHKIAFALLMNRVNVARARAAQDRIAAALASYSG